MTNQKLNDSQLITLYINGDEEAFSNLLSRHKSRVYTTILLIVKDRYLAEDLLQDTFIKAVNTLKGGKYNEEGKFLPWILRIGHNLAIDNFRKAKRNPTIILEDGSAIFNSLDFSEAPVENKHLQHDLHSKIRSLIDELPATQKEVLLMRHYMDLSFKEIADSTGVSINTALGRMRYALINLRKKMKQYNIAYDQDFYPR